MNEKNILKVKEIAQEVDKAGGKAYFVGGYVRNNILNIPNRDIDLEIHGISYHQLKEILSGLGEVILMGNSFGVFGLKGYAIDISMPRKENVDDYSFKNLPTDINPFIPPKEAAKRRDFSINALMQDILTDEIMDFYNGKDDLEKGIIRHIDADLFRLDPLRVFRAAYFAAIYNFEIAEETFELCCKIDVSNIAKERIFQEVKKVLLKAEKPSIFFEILRKMGKLSVWMPELEEMIKVKQEAKYHPEGNVWNHTMLVLDEAAKLRDKAHEPFFFMMASLCHDIGKNITTENIEGHIHSYGHERAGVSLGKVFLRRLSNENNLRSYVLNMIEMHMKPHVMYADNSKTRAFMKMFNKSIEPDDLLLLAYADHLGRGVADDDSQKRDEFLHDMLDKYRELMQKPQVQGRDLIAAGIEEGKILGAALDYAHKLHLAGIEKEEALKNTIGYAKQFIEK